MLNGATLTSREALEIVSGMTGVQRRRRASCPRAVATAAGAPSRAASACAGARRRSAARWSARCCTATATTARAPTRELGLHYTPVRGHVPPHDRVGVEQGLVRRALPGWRVDQSMTTDPTHQAQPAHSRAARRGLRRGPGPQARHARELREPDFAEGHARPARRRGAQPLQRGPGGAARHARQGRRAALQRGPGDLATRASSAAARPSSAGSNSTPCLCIPRVGRRAERLDRAQRAGALDALVRLCPAAQAMKAAG